MRKSIFHLLLGLTTSVFSTAIFLSWSPVNQTCTTPQWCDRFWQPSEKSPKGAAYKQEGIFAHSFRNFSSWLTISMDCSHMSDRGEFGVNILHLMENTSKSKEGTGIRHHLKVLSQYLFHVTRPYLLKCPEYCPPKILSPAGNRPLSIWAFRKETSYLHDSHILFLKVYRIYKKKERD